MCWTFCRKYDIREFSARVLVFCANSVIFSAWTLSGIYRNSRAHQRVHHQTMVGEYGLDRELKYAFLVCTWKTKTKWTTVQHNWKKNDNFLRNLMCDVNGFPHTSHSKFLEPWIMRWAFSSRLFRNDLLHSLHCNASLAFAEILYVGMNVRTSLIHFLIY